jgi:Beta-lactamase
MQLAGNTRADRRPEEVTYYDQDGEDPYGIPVARMDAHGGWLATAVDLMRFAVRVDGFPAPPDILSSASITTMTTKSTAEGTNYAKGWQVNSAGTWWHDGVLQGSSSILVRTSDGFCWAALINTRRSGLDNDPGSDAGSALDQLMWAIHDQVDIWPAGQDL